MAEALNNPPRPAATSSLVPSLQQIGEHSADEDEEKHEHGQMESLPRKIGRAQSQNEPQSDDQERRRVAEIACALPSEVRNQRHRQGEHQRRTAGEDRLQSAAVGNGHPKRGGFEVHPASMYHPSPEQRQAQRSRRQTAAPVRPRLPWSRSQARHAAGLAPPRT